MKSISQNPILKIAGILFCSIGVIISWRFGSGLGSIANVIGLLLTFTGTDTELMKDGIKLGFTKIFRQDIEDVYENGDSEIVLVAKRRRRYRVKRWHYKSDEWKIIKNHLKNLTNEAKHGVTPNA